MVVLYRLQVIMHILGLTTLRKPINNHTILLYHSRLLRLG
jgi:hypothetical protein